jgi:hypothetical protein
MEGQDFSASPSLVDTHPDPPGVSSTPSLVATSTTDSLTMTQPVSVLPSELASMSQHMVEKTSLLTTPLTSYWGLEAQVGVSQVDRDPDRPLGDGGQCNTLGWSRGLGQEISPIKMRSARKKQVSLPLVMEQHSGTTLDSGALRGMKALARAKS